MYDMYTTYERIIESRTANRELVWMCRIEFHAAALASISALGNISLTRSLAHFFFVYKYYITHVLGKVFIRMGTRAHNDHAIAYTLRFHLLLAFHQFNISVFFFVCLFVLLAIYWLQPAMLRVCVQACMDANGRTSVRSFVHNCNRKQSQSTRKQIAYYGFSCFGQMFSTSFLSHFHFWCSAIASQRCMFLVEHIYDIPNSLKWARIYAI